jgi:integrase
LILSREVRHTLSKQVGNSALMIERRYSKLTATMAAERLA